VAVFGTVDFGSGPRALRWVFDRATGFFTSDDSTVTPRNVQFFIDQAAQGLGSNVVLGLPVGLAERFAVDRDVDGLFNEDEVALGSKPFDPDTDGDGDLDGHEAQNGGDPLDDQVGSNDTTAPSISNLRVVYTTIESAKIAFDADEPVRYELDWTMNTFSGEVDGTHFDKTHGIAIPDLRANALHTVSLDVIDLAGNVTNVNVPNVQTIPRTPTLSVVLRAPNVTVVQDSAGTLELAISGKARRKNGPLLSGHQLRVDVYVNGLLTQPLVIGTTSTGNGTTTVNVVENGLTPGDVVHVNVLTVFDVNNNTAALWSMPDTIPAAREWIETYTGTGP